MGRGKGLLTACVVLLSVFVLSQVSYGLGFNVNLETPASTETGKAAKVEEVVGKKPLTPPTGKIGSNTTLLTTELIDKLQADTTAIVNLNVASAADAVNVTDSKAYAIGLGSVRLAQVAIIDNRYDFTDTTINPLLFSDGYAVGNLASFAADVDALKPDQIAVIIAIENGKETIEAIKAIKDRIEAGKVIIVQATTVDSKAAFNTLFEQYNQGFALRSVDTNSPVVIRALQGAV